MISIIMIAYDVESYVAQSIQSVLDQTYGDFELIIVADRGADRTQEICAEFADRDKRIKLICGEANGIADARNRGMEAVSGDYLGFVDSDDYIEPGLFERQLSNIGKYDADIAVCGRFYEFVNKTLSDTPKEPVVMTGEEAIRVTLGHDGFFLHCWDKLYSKKVFEGLRFRTDVTVEDRIVVDTLLSRAAKVVYDPTPMYHFRERSGSNSKRSGMIENNIQADLLMEEFIRKNHPDLDAPLSKFMLYEFITAIQNELVLPDPDKDSIGRYQKKVAGIISSPSFKTGPVLRIKAFMAMHLPLILKIYTKNNQKRTASELERFP
ncbi:MAG: glycosyltransferase [Lachnospiraceae bacterium]|nr:glycosyltransferase [Lachnospiraceae bacterium]